MLWEDDERAIRVFLAMYQVQRKIERTRKVERCNRDMDGLTTFFGIMAAAGTACVPVLQSSGYQTAAVFCTLLASASLAAWGYLTNKTKK